MQRHIACFGKLAIAALVSMLLAAPARADCDTRHFYNNSPVPFDIHLVFGSCSLGGSGTQSTCTIPPRQVAELHYANFPITSDGISVWSLDPGSRIYKGSFVVGILPSRCYIFHSGNTGNIAVNSNADGDIATCGNADWQCQ